MSRATLNFVDQDIGRALSYGDAIVTRANDRSGNSDHIRTTYVDAIGIRTVLRGSYVKMMRPKVIAISDEHVK